MTVLRPNAARMQIAIAYVAEHPGTSMKAVTLHVLESLKDPEIDEASASLFAVTRLDRYYKKAASVTERIIRDRHVRQDEELRLYPWDSKLKAYAEALERAAFAAPDLDRFTATLALALSAWQEAGDVHRVLMLEKLAADRVSARTRQAEQEPPVIISST